MDYSLSESFVSESEKKGRVVPSKALHEVYGKSLPSASIAQCLDELEQHVLKTAKGKKLPAPSREALSNTRGTWFEDMVIVTAWNHVLSAGFSDAIVFKMPNIKRFDFRHLFLPETKVMLDQLDASLRGHEVPVEMVTSNPDLVIVRSSALTSSIPREKLSNLSESNVQYVSDFYKELEQKCPWDSIIAGVGLKTSMRPDRRLQLVHEGNILKSVFAHLKMRNWNRLFSFRYYVASSEPFSKADEKALQTAATHTIVNVDATPERSVDKMFRFEQFDDVRNMLDEILAP